MWDSNSRGDFTAPFSLANWRFRPLNQLTITWYPRKVTLLRLPLIRRMLYFCATRIYSGRGGEIRTHDTDFKDQCLRPLGDTPTYSKTHYASHFSLPFGSVVCFRIPSVTRGYVRVVTLTRDLYWCVLPHVHPSVRPFAPCFKCRARTSFPHSHTVNLQESILVSAFLLQVASKHVPTCS